MPATALAARPATETATVLIADDHGVMRHVLALALEQVGGFRVVGQAQNGREAVDEANRLRPAIVIMDVLMPLLDGLEATRRIHRDLPQTRILVLSGGVGAEAVLDALRAGASAILSKTADLPELARALRALVRGDVYVSPELSGQVLAGVAARASEEGDPLAPLSSREREVVQLIGEGQSTREIAGGLFLSPKTVAQHKANIVRKLGLRGTRDLQILAAKRAAGRQPGGASYSRPAASA